MRVKAVNYGVAFLAILFLNFLLPRLMPGDPLTAIYGEEALLQMTPQLKAHLVERLGLDGSIWKQFLIYLSSLARGDLGYSYYRNAPVSRVMLSHLPWTLLLMGTALILSAIIGVIAGIESGWRRGRPLDRALLVGMMSVSGFPSFFVGVLLLLLFGVILGVLPLQGARTVYSGLSGLPLALDILKHLILPLTSLIVLFTSANYLLTRNTMVMTLREPFILTAKAKGLSEARVRYLHAGRNSLLPVLTSTGVQFGTRIVTGALFVEAVFSYPGMGGLIYNSILMRDYPVLQGCALMVTALVLTVNFAVDLLYVKLDPRVRGNG